MLIKFKFYDIAAKNHAEIASSSHRRFEMQLELTPKVHKNRMCKQAFVIDKQLNGSRYTILDNPNSTDEKVGTVFLEC